MLSKAVSPGVLLKIMDMKDNFQACFRHFLLPRNKGLLNMFMKALNSVHLVSLKEAKFASSPELKKTMSKSEKEIV
jgi:hypothetical protein